MIDESLPQEEALGSRRVDAHTRHGTFVVVLVIVVMLVVVEVGLVVELLELVVV
jgi:hypothetical protein